MSFWSKLKTVTDTILKVGKPTAKAVTIFNPAVGGLVALVLEAIDEADNFFPEPKSGDKKHEYVVDVVKGEAPLDAQIDWVALDTLIHKTVARDNAKKTK